MNRSALILGALCLVGLVSAASLSAFAPVAPALVEVPIEAQDMEMVRLDEEVAHALEHGTITEEAQDVEELAFDAAVTPSAESESADESESDESQDMALLSEGESLSVAVSDDATAAVEEESASAAVDSDEDASFLQVAEEESEDEEESEEEDEEAEDASLIVVHEAEVEEEESAPRLSETNVQIVADEAEAAAVVADEATESIEADEDTAAEAAHQTEMVDVNDFDMEKVAAEEAEEVHTEGRVMAGLSDARVELTNVKADTEKVNGAEVISVISDSDVRAAAGASSFVESDSEAHVQSEQQKLDLMHSILIQLRKDQGRSIDEEMTPEDMDAIEQKMAEMSMVEVTADTETATDARHPRDHTLVAAISPRVEAAADGAALKSVTIVGNEKPQKFKPKYRWDIQYHNEDKHIQYMPARNIEFSAGPHPIHARDPTKPSKLKKPVKPGVWDRRSWAAKTESRRPQYRYDVTYEKRSECCRARQACCIRGVKTKVIGQGNTKAKKPVKIMGKKQGKKAKASKKWTAVSSSQPVEYRWDVVYEQYRAMCCSSKKACCRPPLNMYRSDVQYEAEPADNTFGWVVIARNDQSPNPFVRAGLSKFDDDELAILQRIQSRQRLLHQLLLTHDSPYYDDDVHVATASDAHIIQFHEPAAAAGKPSPRIEGYGRDGDLTRAEFEELQNWLRQLPVVPHLSVVEVDAKAADSAEDAALIEVPAPKMVPVRVLKGFVDVEQKPHTLAALLSALPTPAIAADV